MAVAHLAMLDKALLMRRVSYRNPFERRITDLGLPQLAIRDREIEFRQVATVQVPGQIFRGGVVSQFEFRPT